MSICSPGTLLNPGLAEDGWVWSSHSMTDHSLINIAIDRARPYVTITVLDITNTTAYIPESVPEC